MSRIVPPEISLSDLDRKIIKLLSQIILDDINYVASSENMAKDDVLLTDEQARQLLFLLESLVQNPDFFENSHFLLLFKLPALDEHGRKFYSERRRKRGKSTIMLRGQWYEVLQRVGIENAPADWSQTKEMPFQHFIEMERRLFELLSVHPRVAALLISLIEAEERKLSAMRLRPQKQGVVSPIKKLEKMCEYLKSIVKMSGGGAIPRTDLTGTLILISNFSTLFATRDWTATGVMSAMAGMIQWKGPKGSS